MRTPITKFARSLHCCFSAAFVTTSLLLIAGCGAGTMGSSSTEWSFGGVTAFGNPDVKVIPTNGTTEGGFTVDSSTPVLAAGIPIFLEASFSAEVPNVNAAQYTSPAPQQVGTFSVQWSEVYTLGQTTPRAGFNSTAGTTFTGGTNVAPSVLLAGESGNFVTVSTAGPLTIKLHVTLQTADGSTKSRDFLTTLNIVTATSSAAVVSTATPTPSPTPLPTPTPTPTPAAN